MVSIFLLVLANIIYIIYNMVKGKAKLKAYIKEAKKKRIEDEEKERLEEEERKRKRKEKEEEFSSKLPHSHS
jgi:predicted Holliday junction resolvase-like endonuclease